MNELVQLEGDEQGRRDHREVLRPDLVEPEAGALDELEHAVPEREERRDPHLRGVQVVEIGDRPVEQRSPRIEVDGPEDAFGDAPEIVVHVEEEVDARREQQRAANDPLGCDQAKDASAGGLVLGGDGVSGRRGLEQREPLEAAADARDLVLARLDERQAQTADVLPDEP